MDAKVIKSDLMRWLQNLDDLEVLAKLLSFRQSIERKAIEKRKNDHILPGKPMTDEEFKQRIDAARARVNAGKFTTIEDLEKEAEAW